jgi:ketosteroid isomerase-like protein
MEIETMLHASAGAWNEGDLEGFLDDYWRSDDLSFSGATGVTRGWENVRERYLRSYWAPGQRRDSLRFEELEVSPLGEAHALALGRYVLYQPENGGGVTSTGHFTLILRKMEGAWKIVHDHSSSAAGGPESGASESSEPDG